MQVNPTFLQKTIPPVNNLKYMSQPAHTCAWQENENQATTLSGRIGAQHVYHNTTYSNSLSYSDLLTWVYLADVCWKTMSQSHNYEIRGHHFYFIITSQTFQLIIPIYHGIFFLAEMDFHRYVYGTCRNRSTDNCVNKDW